MKKFTSRLDGLACTPEMREWLRLNGGAKLHRSILQKRMESGSHAGLTPNQARLAKLAVMNYLDRYDVYSAEFQVILDFLGEGND